MHENEKPRKFKEKSGNLDWRQVGEMGEEEGMILAPQIFAQPNNLKQRPLKAGRAG